MNLINWQVTASGDTGSAVGSSKTIYQFGRFMLGWHGVVLRSSVTDIKLSSWTRSAVLCTPAMAHGYQSTHIRTLHCNAYILLDCERRIELLQKSLHAATHTRRITVLQTLHLPTFHGRSLTCYNESLARFSPRNVSSSHAPTIEMPNLWVPFSVVANSRSLSSLPAADCRLPEFPIQVSFFFFVYFWASLLDLGSVQSPCDAWDLPFHQNSWLSCLEWVIRGDSSVV